VIVVDDDTVFSIIEEFEKVAAAEEEEEVVVVGGMRSIAALFSCDDVDGVRGKGITEEVLLALLFCMDDDDGLGLQQRKR